MGSCRWMRPRKRKTPYSTPTSVFAAITVRVGRGEALLATLLFPAASPLFISAVKCTTAVLEGQPWERWSNWMTLAAGFDVLYYILALLTFEFVLED